MKKINLWQKQMVIAIVLVLVAFYGGMKYGESKSAAVDSTNTQGSSFRGAGSRGMRGGGGVAGQIVAKDATSITVEMRDGSGSRIVFYTASTPVLKSITDTAEDLKIGETVTVSGTANTDGSLSAQSIQIRPAGLQGAPTAPGAARN